LADQDKRTSDARQHRLDDAAELRRKALDDQAAREARDKEEFERRRALGLDDKKEARTQAASKTKGRIAGVQARFEALRPQITNPDTLKSVESSLRKLQEALNNTTDPDEQEGLLASIDDLLKPETLVRMAEGAAKAKEAGKTKPQGDFSNPENADYSKEVWEMFGMGSEPTAAPAAAAAPAGSIPASTDAEPMREVFPSGVKPASRLPSGYYDDRVGSVPDPSAGLMQFQADHRNIAGPLRFQYEDELNSITNLLKKPAPSGPMQFGSGFRVKSMFG
jgi:hypothetical protein